jgi:hypothetical protein
MNKEKERLKEHANREKDWKLWGPYISERQWGTVREDYSANGDAWNYTTHDQSRSRAYRWGEEGIGGICDRKQLLCFSLAFWNGKDPILKETFFGLSGPQGNHGEDVKEYFYYLDNLPTHSYMKMLYKYPQDEYPYSKLVNENSKRNKKEREYELIDTGVFSADRYFDIFIEYAKNGPQDILIKITAHNRGEKPALLYLIPQLWFRNTWAWGYDDYKPYLTETGRHLIEADHKTLGRYFLYTEGGELLFCENETNVERLYDSRNKGKVKDGINDFIVNGDDRGIASEKEGTKAGIEYKTEIEGNSNIVLRLRLTKNKQKSFLSDFDSIFLERKKESDEFYGELQKNIDDMDKKEIQRQAFAGMLWNKQFYNIDISQWLRGDPAQPVPPAERLNGRNSEWIHLNNEDVISMPDKWEYPWYAAWDLAFHCIPLALVDPDLAKRQLALLTREWYMHPNGELPAYEWNFSDVNPPLHAYAAWRVYKIDEKASGKKDIEFLESVFHKLMLNFTWWVNRKDAQNRNIFQGGFLGLDNIGIFDRSSGLPGYGRVEQADATSWMAMYCLNLMRISIELAGNNPTYQDMASKFFQHFLYIAGAMTNIADRGIDLWNEEDEFFYDVLYLDQKYDKQIKIRSMVGLIPLFAVEVLEPDLVNSLPEFSERLSWFLNYRKDLSSLVSRWHIPGKGERRLLSLLRGHRMKRLLYRMLDEIEFLSDYGVRSLSKYYLEHPYTMNLGNNSYTINYEPAEAETGLFGGNSNWRGPIWFPANFLIIESLQRFHHYYGDEFKVEYPTGSEQYFTLKEIAEKLAERLIKLFTRNSEGKRPVFGQNEKFQRDPHFKDYLLFYEYFNGDTGEGLGASHQTGWTGLIAKLLQPRGKE